MKKFLSVLLLIFVLTVNSFGSLTFAAASTDKVNHGSASNLDNLNTITVLVWARPTAFTNDGFFWSKTDTGFTAEKFFLVRNTGNMRVEIGRATTYATSESSDSTLSAGTWYLVGMSWDGSTAPKLYRKSFGNLTPIAEVSSYSTATAGSGTIADDSANSLLVGNITTADTISFIGQIDTVMIFNRVLTVQEMIGLTYYPRNISGCVLLSRYNGTGTQADYSGNGNTGTITTAAASSSILTYNHFGL